MEKNDTPPGEQQPVEEGKKILIVDDDVEIVDTIQTVLQANGYAVVFGAMGPRAW